MPPVAAGGGAGAALGGGPVTAEAVDIATELQVKPPMAFLLSFVWEQSSHAVGVPQWGGGGAARPSVPGAGAACSVLGAVGAVDSAFIDLFRQFQEKKPFFPPFCSICFAEGECRGRTPKFVGASRRPRDGGRGEEAMAALEHESPAAAGGASPWEASTPRRVVQCVPARA